MTTRAEHVVPPASIHPSAARPRIVIADDSPDMRSLLSDLLTGEGFDVITVASGGRALSEMLASPPDLLITDLMMPGMSGFHLRALMLRRPELSGIPVIVLSAYWHRPSETLEVAEVLTKPLNIERLVETARRLTRSSASASEIECGDAPSGTPPASVMHGRGHDRSAGARTDGARSGSRPRRAG